MMSYRALNWLCIAAGPIDECMHAAQMLNGKEGFLSSDRLKKFSTHRNDPNQPEALSGLSPYYHFGHLAAQRSALEASKLRSKAKVNSPVFRALGFRR